MYIPSHFAEDRNDVVLELVRRRGFGHLVCGGDGGLTSTPVPFLIDDDLSSVRAHVARPNPIWQLAPCRALLIVAVADVYVSPTWYPSKQEHGKVVPTWNYEVVHLHGHLITHDDPAWVRQQINDLTDQNEAVMPEPWEVSDAPAKFIEVQARAIVGIELLVDRVESKRKLSQNRSDSDRAGVIDGLRINEPTKNTIAVAMQR